MTRSCSGLLLLGALATASCRNEAPTSVIASKSPAFQVGVAAGDKIPKPHLTLDSRTPTPYSGSDGLTYLRYDLSVKNSDAFPDALFAAAPSLPPCGLNTAASRTWISIYDGNDNYIYGFCGLVSASGMNDILFSVRQGDAPPARIYITVWDRETNTVYTSNTIRIPN